MNGFKEVKIWVYRLMKKLTGKDLVKRILWNSTP